MINKSKELTDRLKLPQHEVKYVIECPKCQTQREIDAYDLDHRIYAGCKCKNKIKISRDKIIATTTIRRHLGI